MGETLDLSELLWKPVVFLYLVGLVVCYGLWGGIGILVIVVGGLLISLLMRSQPLITLELKPGKTAPEEDATCLSETAEAVAVDRKER